MFEQGRCGGLQSLGVDHFIRGDRFAIAAVLRGEVPDGVARIFRREAVRHADVREPLGRPLPLSRSWVSWTAWLLAAFAALGLAFTALASIGVYARGPAIVRIEGRSVVTARTAGVISQLFVEPGARVRRDQLLVQLHDDTERAALLGLEQEYAAALADLLRDPTRVAVRDRVAAIVTQRELARAQLAARGILAPHDGVVLDSRVRLGQALAPGDEILVIERDARDAHVVALIPGEHRPRIHVGQTTHVEFDGFANQIAEVTIEHVGDELIGRSEVARFLGEQPGDTVDVADGVVLVRGRLSSRELRFEGRSLRLFDGMKGRATIRVRTESILAAMLPSLRRLRPDEVR